MFQHNIQFVENIEDMNYAQLEYMESCCLGVCYVSIVLICCLVMITQDALFYFESLFSMFFMYGQEILIFAALIMITGCGVIIIVNTVTEYTYKIDRTIAKLNETIKEKNNEIQELENQINCMKRKMINLSL
jgi:cell division protein FtsW (lipid II flippase)